MRRLYSSEMDGRSFNRLEWSLLGYDGPTLLIVKTDQDAIIGAFAEQPWAESLNFFGSCDCFLFQLFPEVRIRWAIGGKEHFMYMHSGELTSSLQPHNSLPHGIGFGGSLASKPRFFIPDSLENGSAEFMDKTYETGEILPESAMEKFEINVLEVWGVGSQELIDHALQKRVERRTQTEDAIQRARTVANKTQFLRDLESGFTPSNVYKHRDDVRGREEFRVDDIHGGYKVDKE
jgi:hypothetical protein